ncbi:hypothetical protein DWX80_18400 [Ruminococcus sp. AF21-3]|nr:hypothetical protein DWX80_18400 [Ruminococcus sp. AF21-3]
MANEQNKENGQRLSCGVIMPIAASQGYTEEHWKNVLNMPIAASQGIYREHWKNVLNIIRSAIEKTNKFDVVPVWENFKSDIIHDTIINNLLKCDIVICDIIHDTIINNLLKCDIVICDISTTNPNVMYELGLRMTIKKPVVIIKDDK